jgi:hypothetical protein
MESASIFQSEDGLQEVRLSGPLNTYEFWQQPEVLTELKMLLADKLSTKPLFESTSASPADAVSIALSDSPSPAAPRPSRGYSLFRKKEASSVDVVPAPTPDSMIDVSVDLEDICLRTESDFGLYETISRPAVVIRVNAKC